MGLSVIMNILIQPIFLLLWIDNVSNYAIFEENQLILKGFLYKTVIEYKNIRDITFTDLTQAILVHFNPKFQMNMYTRLFIWNYSIRPLIDEIRKRAGLPFHSYPDKVNRANFNGKVWFLGIMALTIAVLAFFL